MALPVSVTFTALPTMTSGIYPGTLVVNTNDAAQGTFNVPVTMTVVAPAVCGFTSSSPDDVGQTTVFTNTSTGTGPMSYSWNFGDGTPVSSAVHPTHPYTEVGLYTVVLTATNSWGVSVCSGLVGIVWPRTAYLPIVIK
jgi:PKD repeat protein